MSETEVTREGQRGIRPGGQAVPGSSIGRRWGKRKRAEQPMVPRAEFTSYYGKPVINAPVWRSPDIPGYLFLCGLAGASSLLGAGAQLTGRPSLAQAAKSGAFGAGCLSMVALVHDLGRPARFTHMLWVFKVSSPMSVGSWLLSAYVPATGVAAASALTGRVPRLGAAATAGAALLGPAVAAYTGALISDTAVPAWHDGFHEMPFAGRPPQPGRRCVVRRRPARRLRRDPLGHLPRRAGLGRQPEVHRGPAARAPPQPGSSQRQGVLGYRRSDRSGLRVAIQAGEVRVVGIEVTSHVTGCAAISDHADRERDRQHGHDQVVAREHDETTSVQVRASREQLVRGQYQDHADERVHRHRDQQQETPEYGQPPPDRLRSDDGQEVQVADGEVEAMFGLVDRGIVLDQVARAMHTGMAGLLTWPSQAGRLPSRR